MANLTLITVPTSPYAARVRIQALEKGLDLKLVDPPGGMGSAELRALSPFGKVPVLQAEGRTFIESSAIQEYLEDIFPEPSLRGKNAAETAQVRTMVCAIDQYLFPLIFPLRLLQPKDEGVAETLADISDRLNQCLNQMATLCGGEGYLVGARLSLADCALVPAAFYASIFLARHGKPTPFETIPVYRRWAKVVGQHASVRQTMDQIKQVLVQKARG